MNQRTWVIMAAVLAVLGGAGAALLPALAGAGRTPEAWTADILHNAREALERLPAVQRERVIEHAHGESCPCGCGHDVLGCVETDPTCPSRSESATVIGRIAAAIERSGEPRAGTAGIRADVPSADAIRRSHGISTDEARRLLDRGRCVFVDARKPEAYRRGHVPGAINVPLQEFDTRFPLVRARLASAGAVVTYCPRGCSVSALLARKLIELNIGGVRVLAEGWEGWREGGHPVSVDDAR